MLQPVLVTICLIVFAFSGHAQIRSLNGFDVSDAIIPVRDIESGGPPRDGIPAINAPSFVAAEDAQFLEPDSRILGVDINGIAKAYPIAILNWHEIVNDRIGTQHIAVTYCPLCGTGMIFASNISGDAALVFGVSGLLYNSDVLLYDRNTESLWSQIMRKAVSGPLINTPLPQIPATHTSWQRWQLQHPNTLVLDTQTGYRRDYRRSPYAGYERSRKLYFDVANKAPKDYHPKAMVMGVEVDGVFKAYPFKELKSFGQPRFNDEINGAQVSIVWDEDSDSAEVFFPDGKKMPSTTGYWFAWYAFYPETIVFRASE